MRTHKLSPYFFTIAADGDHTPDADSLNLVNRGDDVLITMNETSMTLLAGESISIEPESGVIKDIITIEFLGSSKELLIIEGRKSSLID